MSPLLANIALDGLEAQLSSKYGYIRYADDLVVTARSEEDLQAVRPIIDKFFAERGLSLSAEKTRCVSVSDGFNFLGFNVRTYNGKCLVKPQKEKVLQFLKEIRLWLKSHRTVPAEAVIQHLNPILRGWANYYKCVNSKQTFDYVDHQIWSALWRWCLRRHRKKSKNWVFRRYFKCDKGRAWTFFGKTRNYSTGNTVDIKLFRISTIPIVSHVKVVGRASPDDATLQDYWRQRTKKGRYTQEEHAIT